MNFNVRDLNVNLPKEMLFKKLQILVKCWAQLEFERVYYDLVVLHFSHYVIWLSPVPQYPRFREDS